MDTVDSNKRTSAEHPESEQYEELDEEDNLPTSIADIEDILQYEGEEVTIDSQQTTTAIVDEDTNVYLDIASVDGGTEPDEFNALHSDLVENVIEDSLDDEMVIVEESSGDSDEHTKSPTSTMNLMKTESMTRAENDVRSPSYVDQEKVLFMKLNTNDDDRRTVIMNIKTSDDRVAIDVKKGPPMTKNHVTPEPIFGHTVNLLNNNKILIKSVKTTNSASASPILGKDEIPSMTTMTTPRCDKIDENSVHSNAVDRNKCRTSCDSSNSTKMDVADKATSKNVPFENEIGVSVSGALKMSTTAAAIAAAASTSTPKMNREFEMLTKTVNESKVLTEFIIDQSTRGRRSLKASTKRKQQLIPNTSMGSNLSTISVTESQNELPMSDARSRSKESDKSGTSGSVQSGTGMNTTGKRSTRSQNSDFSAKQRRFLKGIQQITRGTDDESENSAFDDDDDDIDYDCDIETKQPNESGSSFSQPKIECDEIDEEKMSIVSPSDKVSFAFCVSSRNERKENQFEHDLMIINGQLQYDSDTFCWRCHQGECQISCSTCIRAYHLNCVKVKQSTLHEQDDWQCPECVDLQAAETDDKKYVHIFIFIAPCAQHVINYFVLISQEIRSSTFE